MEIGTGPGYITRVLEKKFKIVIGTDINLQVLLGRKENAVMVQLRNGFEVIVCNMPYLATDTIEDVATDGGPGGILVPSKIIRSAVPHLAAGGRFYFVTSSDVCLSTD